MEIRIDEEAIGEAIQRTATKALSDAVGGYSVQQQMAEIVSDAVVSGAIGQALRQAAEQIDVGALRDHLAREISRAVTSAAVVALREAAVAVVLDLRKFPSYAKEEERARARVEVLRELERAE